MDKTTFKDPDVVARLADYVKLKYQAEQPSAPATKPVLDYFGVRGLPTYVVLMPRQAEVK
jgi:thiol:disulfide interchange protein